MKRITIHLYFLFITLLMLFPFNSFAADTTRMNLPEGAIARLGKGTIREIAYSPNGKHLAVAGSVGIWIYDMTTYQVRALLADFIGTVNSVAFSPNGGTIVGGSDDGNIVLWDVGTGKKRKKFKDAAWVLSVTYSPDGKTIATGSGHVEGLGPGIYLWDSHTGKLQRTLLGHVYDTLSLCFSPDGKTLASGGQSGNNDIRLWDLETGIHLKTLEGHTDFEDVNDVVFSPDGNIIASGSGDKTIRLWSPHTGLLLKTLTEHTAPVNSVVFSPDGKILMSAGGDRICVWDAHTAKLKKVLAVSAISVVFSPDGSSFVSGSSDGIRIWETHTTELLKTIPQNTGSVNSVVFSPNGNTIVTGRGNDIDFWDVNTNKHLKTLTGHTDSVSSVVFSPDGKTIASGSNDKNIRLWDVKTSEHINTLIGHKGWVSDVTYSPNGKIIASGSNDKTIRFWDVNTGELLKTLTGHIENVNTIAFSPDGNTIASGSGRLVYHGRVHDQGTCEGQEIRLWNVNSGKLIKTLAGHTSVVNSVFFSPDGKTIASASGHWAGYESFYSDGEEIRLWNVNSGEPIKTLTGHTDVVSSVVFSPDGNFIVSGDWYDDNHYNSGDSNSEIRVWNTHTGEQIKTLKGYTGGVSSLAFSPDGKTLASGKTDGTVILWDFSTFK